MFAAELYSLNKANSGRGAPAGNGLPVYDQSRFCRNSCSIFLKIAEQTRDMRPGLFPLRILGAVSAGFGLAAERIVRYANGVKITLTHFSES